MKGRLKHIPKKSIARQQAGSTKYSIRTLLLEEGYTEKEIQQMVKEDRILVAVPNLRKGIESNAKLYILETEKDIDDAYLSNEVDRFRNLDIE